jgi:excisionase family DNA binding protein
MTLAHMPALATKPTVIGDLIDANEAAARLRLSPPTVRRLAKCGDLPAYDVAGRYRFDEREIDRYLIDHRIGSRR